MAVAEGRDEVRSLGVIPNRLESIRKLVKTLGPGQHLRACYEAGPTGYVLYWQLTQLGVACDVIAPSLVLAAWEEFQFALTDKGKYPVAQFRAFAANRRCPNPRSEPNPLLSSFSEPGHLSVR